VQHALVIGVAPITVPQSTTSIIGKSIRGTRISTLGITIGKAERTNTYEMRLLVLRILPGATTTSGTVVSKKNNKTMCNSPQQV